MIGFLLAARLFRYKLLTAATISNFWGMHWSTSEQKYWNLTYWSKPRIRLYYPAFRPIVQVLSTPWVDSTVVPSACKLSSMGDSSLCIRYLCFKNRFSLGIHVPTPCKHRRFIYFKHAHEQTNIWNQKQIR